MKATLPKSYTPRTPRPYSNPAHLLEIYNYMREYEEKWECKPSNKDFVEDGLVSSTSLVRFYLGHMEKYKMIRQPKVFIGGKLITPSRSIILLPLDKADTVIVNLITAPSVVK